MNPKWNPEMDEKLLDAKFSIRVYLEKSEGEIGFAISSPDLPGCISQGDNVPDALRNMADAVELWMEG